MKRTLAGITLALMVCSAALPLTAAEKPLDLRLKRHHRSGTTVEIVLENTSDKRRRFPSPWMITRAKTGEVVAQFHWARNERSLAPGESAEWLWDQREGAYTSEPAPSEERPRVGPGGYLLTIDEDEPRLARRFHIGRFFTLGFEDRDDTFVVFVNERKPIRQMKSEAKAEDKTLIVSGIVRGEVAYNDPWSYSMGPGSIVLGEVFIEVCDGNPRYVEKHRDEWMGKRWCPWSSYVAKTGR